MYKLSDQVRAVARDRYVLPALRAGNKEITIKVRSLLDELVPLGFPASNTPQVCNALRSGKFLKENGLEITSVDGPPSKLSTTVVVHYRAIQQSLGAQRRVHKEELVIEDVASRAKRLADALRGLLRDELREQGGAEAFVRRIRSDEEAA